MTEKTVRELSEEEVIRCYGDMVYRLALVRTGTRYHADDVFQEVFLRFLQKKPQFASEEHRKAWFLRVTINCANNFWASAWFGRMAPLDEFCLPEQEEERGLLEELQALPPRYRDVIHLFYYEEMSVKEIAQTLHRRESTVRTQLTRARRKLKILLEEG